MALPPPPPAVVIQGDAVDAAIRLMEQPGFTWVGRPQPVLVEELSYADAIAKAAPAEGDYTRWPAYTPVWFIILRGTWDLMPLGPPGATLTPNRFDGCLFVLMTAQDYAFMGAGDSRCP